MKALKTFEVWHTNEYGFAMQHQKAYNFRDCYNRCSAKIQRTFYEIVDATSGDSITREELFPKTYEEV